MGIERIGLGEARYPALLRQIPDPPIALYYEGDLSLADWPCLAVVGARKASGYGKWVAGTIARRAAEHGIAVVSGMAGGIDAAAHRGALEAGGPTIAVLGCGIDICYPASNKDLYGEIRRRGLLLSEFEPGAPPLPYRFPQRNRIISGLSRAVVIAEAGLASGSLITAERAADQGRDVFAVPANINATSSIGCNKLIRDGATPIVVVDDVLDAMGVGERRAFLPGRAPLGKDEEALLRLVAGEGETTLDLLCRRTGRSAAEIGALVTVLEMKGELVTSMGKIFIAKF